MQMRRIFWAVVCLTLILFVSPNRVFAKTVDSPTVSAESAVLIEATTGRVIYQKQKDKPLSMASTTKIMTALLTLECGDLDAPFVVDPTAIQVEGSSMGLQVGDTVTLHALVCGMLLASGNDAANAAAVRVAGSIEAFAEQMNQRGQEIGMHNTHFVTPSGLDDQAHYSTAHDMARLARVALQNNAFAEICSKSSLRVSYGNPPYDRWLQNHNRLLREYDGAIGVKTGFTKKSGRCLVSAAERDGVKLIAVTLNAPNDWQDHTTMLNYGFQTVSLNRLSVSCDDIRLAVVGGQSDSISVKPLCDTLLPLNQSELSAVTQTITADPFYYAPIQAGDVVGNITFYLDRQKIAETALVAAESVPQNITEIKLSVWERIKQWLADLLRIITGHIHH